VHSPKNYPVLPNDFFVDHIETKDEKNRPITNPEPRLLAVVDGNGKLSIFEISSSGTYELIGQRFLRRGSSIQQSSDSVWGGCSTGDVNHQWKFASSRPQHDHDDPNHGGSYAPTGKVRVTAAVRPPRLERSYVWGSEYAAPSTQVSTMCFSADGKILACGWLDGHLSIINLERPNRIDPSSPSSIEWPPNDHCFNLHGVASEDGCHTSHSVDFLISVGDSFVTGSSDGTFNVVPIRGDIDPSGVVGEIRTVLCSGRPQPEKEVIMISQEQPSSITSMSALTESSFIVGTADGRLQRWTMNPQRTSLNEVKEYIDYRSNNDRAHATVITGVWCSPTYLSFLRFLL
jgi:hypothetical protein